jgi:hypothetical protein
MNGRAQRRVVTTLGRAGAVVAFFILVFFVSFEFLVSWRAEEVTSDRVRAFPAVVVRPEGAEIVFLDSVDLGHRDGSFLIPPAEVDSTNYRLRKWQEERGAKGIPEVRVVQLSEDKQLIDLEFHKDGISRSSYEASDRSIRPVAITIAGPLFIFYPLATATLFTLMVIYFVGWLSRRQIIR